MVSPCLAAPAFSGTGNIVVSCPPHGWAVANMWLRHAVSDEGSSAADEVFVRNHEGQTMSSGWPCHGLLAFCNNQRREPPVALLQGNNGYRHPRVALSAAANSS